MTFSVSLSGHVNDPATAEGEEQALVDDLKALVAKHADKISYASGSFQYQGAVDLVAAAAPAPVPVPTTDPSGFVPRIEGETYTEAQARLFTFNAGKPETEQAGVPTEAEWDAMIPTPAPDVVGGADGPVNPNADPVVHPDGLVVKLADDTYHAYVERASAAGATAVLTEIEWNAESVSA